MTATTPRTAPVSEGSADWLAALAGAPLPSRRQEDWRFTDLTTLRSVPHQVASSENGGWIPPHLPSGITTLADGDAETHRGRAVAGTACADHWPVRFNAGLGPATLALRVGAGTWTLELPWEGGSMPGCQARRLLLVLEPGADLQLLQVIRATDDQALSLVVEVEMGPESRLKLGTLALGRGARSTLLAHTAVRQAAGSELSLISASSGWGLIRQEPRVVQLEGAAHTQLRGLQLVDGQEVADTHSHVRFEGPAGVLDQLHKAVADGSGRSVFNGAVQVPRVAQQTNAAQLSRNLLLSDRARIDTKPELEIVADDVKCAHGATVSRLQRDELFYLQSRGIAAAQAAALLQRGFCDEVLRELPAAAAPHRPLQSLLGEV
ncbi:MULTISPECIES: SufB/SufD family protein [Aphanothece]|uniref:SufB/SufD family protein n=1 Tax=Aphanothece TaxID=1121 RepID=UPI003984E24B